MQRTHYEVSIDGARHDAFVHVAAAFVERELTPLFGAQVPPVVVLRLRALAGGDGGEVGGDVGDGVVYAGCLAQRPQHAQSPYTLRIAATLAGDLRLRDGDLVECAALPRVPRATRVSVAPLTVDESEVVEANASRIEAQLLRQVQVVFAGMPVTVTVFAGVRARVRVEQVECGGVRLERGPALMTEGTLFVIATRARRPAATSSPAADGDGAAAAPPPLPWAMLRALPVCDGDGGDDGGDASVVRMPARVAARLGWRDGVALDALDVALLAQHADDDHHGGDGERGDGGAAAAVRAAATTLTPSFLRAHVRRVRVRLVEGAGDDDDAAGLSMPACVWPWVRQPTNVLLQLPSSAEAAVARGEGGEGDGDDSGRRRVAASSLPFVRDAAAAAAATPASRRVGVDVGAVPSLSQLRAVHGGDVVDALLQRLRYTFAGAAPCANGNVLVCGGKGYGKTALVAGVMRELCAPSRRGGGGGAGVHVAWLTCTASGKGFLASLQRAVAECVLCAPSVLVLDDVHVIAPAQSDGGVPAMSPATRATLAAVLSSFARGPCLCGGGGSGCGGCGGAPAVAVVATCAASRDDVHADFRTAACFATCLTMAALTPATRAGLLRQLLLPRSLPARAVRHMAGRMDNYTPFDVCRVVARARRAADAGGEGGDDAAAAYASRLRRAVEACVASFRPLAHTGIKFLGDGGGGDGGGGGGGAGAWDDIGGLREAKKVLYDTLVLPMRHRALFARLPLKTRSGILLYGPSGCGKTFVVEALVRAHGLHCVVVNGPEVFGKYIGQSEQKIRDVFDRAQAAAPCVVFFDEFDAVAPQRGSDNAGVTDRVVNQLLCYLDGVEGRKDVFVVAASSRPDLIDAALLRPGRLDKAVQCGVPTADDRADIVRHLLARAGAAALAADAALLRDVAARTVNWTPADLAAAVASASTHASQRALRALTSRARNGDGGGDDGFVIAGVAAGVAREKVADALRRHVATSSSASRTAGGGEAAAATASLLQMTRADLDDALATTRPSLTARDLARAARIHDLFAHGRTPTPAQPGTKVTFS